MSSPVRADGKPRSAWARFGAAVASITIVVSCLCFALMAIGQHGQPGSTTIGMTFVGFVFIVPICLLLPWRFRFPRALTLSAAAVALVFPTTPLPALFAFTSLARTPGQRGTRTLGILVVCSVLVSTLWDVSTANTGMSLASIFLGLGEKQALWWAAPWLVPLSSAVLIAPFAATIIIRNVSRQRDEAIRTEAMTRTRASDLHTEVERQMERRELAREIHDTLASRLSSLSLHAGALEREIGTRDPQLADNARIVRASAQSSLNDLRDVVSLLRDPDGAYDQPRGRALLTDIDTLITEAHEAGDRLRAHVSFADVAGCDPAVAHASYRIVQEALSNARRHAPGADVALNISARPSTGVLIQVTNPVSDRSEPSSFGGRNGVTGMRERAEAVHGTLAAHVEDGQTFIVSAHLPWLSEEKPAERGSEGP